MTYFKNLHPAVRLMYFTAVLIPAFFSGDIILPAVILVGGSMSLVGTGKIKTAALSLLIIPSAAVIDPLFDHRGNTELFFVNGNAYTLESMIYGASGGMALVAAIVICIYLSETFGDREISYLLSSRAPKTALVTSAALRTIPDLKRKYTEIRDAAIMTGRYREDKFIAHLVSSFRLWSALAAAIFEDARLRAELSEARGFGRGDPVRATVIRPMAADFVCGTLAVAALAAMLLISGISGYGTEYYPVFSLKFEALKYIPALIAFLPSILDIIVGIRENRITNSGVLDHGKH